jgi:L-amino acid N-acyltransferase YncA
MKNPPESIPSNHSPKKSEVSMSEYLLSPITQSDQKPVIDLFNYYIENSYAAYPERRVPYEFFILFMNASRDYPSVAIRSADGALLGFGMLHSHNPMPAFSHTAEITYFVQPGMTGRGLGSKMLAYLEAEGKKRGISCILASISSRNEGSIRFHEKNGFAECGRFRGVGKKKGIYFDTVWMQKAI